MYGTDYQGYDQSEARFRFMCLSFGIVAGVPERKDDKVTLYRDDEIYIEYPNTQEHTQ